MCLSNIFLGITASIRLTGNVMLHITTTWIILVRGCGLLDDVVMFAAMKAVLKCDVMYPMQLFYVMPVDVSAKVMRWYLCEAQFSHSQDAYPKLRGRAPMYR